MNWEFLASMPFINADFILLLLPSCLYTDRFWGLFFKKIIKLYVLGLWHLCVHILCPEPWFALPASIILAFWFCCLPPTTLTRQLLLFLAIDGFSEFDFLPLSVRIAKPGPRLDPPHHTHLLWPMPDTATLTQESSESTTNKIQGLYQCSIRKKNKHARIEIFWKMSNGRDLPYQKL